MSKVIVLYRDGTFNTISEKKLRKTEVRKIEHILIPTHTDDKVIRNYIMTRPTALMRFQKAVIEYQLGYYLVEDTLSEQIDPIHVETSSITTLFDLLACIDQLNCTNQLIDDRLGYEATSIKIEYFGVQLYDATGKVIYDRYYTNVDKGDFMYYSGHVLKQFSELYDNVQVNDMVHEKEFLYLENGKWFIGDLREESHDMIGVPLVLSSTITFLTEDEYHTLTKYHELEVVTSVYEANSDLHEEMVAAIKINDQDTVENLSFDMNYYLNTANKFYLVNSTKYTLLDFLTHMNYCIRLVDLVITETNKPSEDYTPHTCIILAAMGNGLQELLYFVDGSIPSLTETLAQLKPKKGK